MVSGDIEVDRSKAFSSSEQNFSDDVVVERGSHGGHSVFLQKDQEEESNKGQATYQEKIEQQLLRKKEKQEGELQRPEVKAALAEVDNKKAEGNKAFQAGDQDLAIAAYKEAISMLLGPALATTECANQYTATLRCNIAAAAIKKGAHHQVIRECTHALKIDAGCVKALFRRATSFQALGHFTNAIEDLMLARNLEPNNMTIAYAIEDAEDLLAEEGDTPYKEDTLWSDVKGKTEEHKHGHEGEGDSVSEAQRKEDEDFALACMREAMEEYRQKGEVESLVVLNHATMLDTNNHEEDINSSTESVRSIGKMVIEGAFGSYDLLKQAIEFVQSQHVTAQATSACVVVQKKKMLYPLVWWAGTWPYEVNQDGVFVEFISRPHGYRRIWFMPCEANGTLSMGTELAADCALTEDLPPIFI